MEKPKVNGEIVVTGECSGFPAKVQLLIILLLSIKNRSSSKCIM